MSTAPTGALEVVKGNASRFTNTLDGDMAIYPSTSTQRLHLGTVLGATSSVEVTSSNVNMYAAIDLKGVPIKSNGVTVIDATGNVVGASSLALTGGTMTGQILGSGTDTAATPAYAFSNDANTGLFNKSTGVIGLSCGGTEIFALSNLGASLNGELTCTSNIVSKGLRISN